MKTKDIVVGQEYAVRRGRTGGCCRVRVEESARVHPWRSESIWRRQSPALLPDEPGYAAGAAEVRFRCTSGEDRIDHLGQWDARRRCWLHPREFVSSWAEYEAERAATQDREEEKRRREVAEQEAWRPLVKALWGFGIESRGWDLPREDRLEVVLNREQAARIIKVLDAL